MNMQLIAILTEENSIKGNIDSKVIGYRIIDKDAKEVKDIQCAPVYKVLSNGIKIGGLKIEQIYNKITGSNGALERYTNIVVNKKTIKNINSAIILYKNNSNNAFVVSNYIGKTAVVAESEIVKSVQKGKIALANGKVVKGLDNTSFVSAINGNYDSIEITKNNTVSKSKEECKKEIINRTENVNSKVNEIKSTIVQAKTKQAFESIRKTINSSIGSCEEYKSLVDNINTIQDKDGNIIKLTIDEKMTMCKNIIKKLRPFYYSVVCALNIKESSQVETFGVAIQTMYFNKDYVLKQKYKVIVFCLLHEIMHVVMKHRQRQGNREDRKWNVACDYYINNLLSLEFGLDYYNGIRETEYIATPEDWYYFSKTIPINDLSAEIIYEAISEDERARKNEANNGSDDSEEDDDNSSNNDNSNNNSNNNNSNNNDSENNNSRDSDDTGSEDEASNDSEENSESSGDSSNEEEENSSNSDGSGGSESDTNNSDEDENSDSSSSSNGTGKEDDDSNKDSECRNTNGNNKEDNNNEESEEYSSQNNGDKEATSSDELDEQNSNGVCDSSDNEEDTNETTNNKNKNNSDKEDKEKNKEERVENNNVSSRFNSDEQKQIKEMLKQAMSNRIDEKSDYEAKDELIDIIDDEETEGCSDETAEFLGKSILAKAVTIAKMNSIEPGSDVESAFFRSIEASLVHNVSWRAILSKMLTKARQKITTLAAPDKRFRTRGLILPGPRAGQNDSLEKIWAFIDTSGSTSNSDLGEALLQIKQLVSRFNTDVELCYWDTRIRATYNYKNVKDIKDIIKDRPAGGGGTNANCIFEYLDMLNKKKYKRSFDAIVLVFTDGYIGKVDAAKFKKYKNTIWIINGGYYSGFKAQFGVKAPFKNKE